MKDLARSKWGLLVGGVAFTDRLGQQVGYQASQRFAFPFLEFLLVSQDRVVDIYGHSHGALMIFFFIKCQ